MLQPLVEDENADYASDGSVTRSWARPHALERGAPDYPNSTNAQTTATLTRLRNCRAVDVFARFASW